MPNFLEYAPPTPPIKTNALPAMICGFCSGPAGFALAWVATANSLPEQSKESLALVTLLMTLGGTFIFACAVRLKLSRSASRRDRIFANAAVAAPPLWGVAIVAFIAYGLGQV
jgi:hypothetical protein